MPHDRQFISTAITAAIIIIVMALRFRKLNREVPLRLEVMWIVPLFLASAAAVLLWRFPPHGAEWVWITAAFAVGAGLGWWRGSLIPIHVDVATGRVMNKVSPAALIFIVVVMVMRAGARWLLHTEAAAWHVDPMLLTDAFVVMGVGLFGVSRLEMAMRATRCLAAHKASAGAAA
jgi:multisubunit Na+/H+ antiporter MnhB subunit